jgi:hypothetical protein
MLTKARRNIIVIENFYDDPMAVREYALRQKYYLPYEEEEEVKAGRRRATWWASYFNLQEQCPFKSSKILREALEAAVGERLDMEHWQASFPVGADSKPTLGFKNFARTCLWNCCFHVKPDNQQRLGDGVHNHVTDGWNSVGTEGWAGIIYLTPDAPIEGGLHLWRNTDPSKQFDWMTPSQNWQAIDSFGNLYNRLILVRGDIPHSGAKGWGDRLEQGRMFQTFFFKTLPDRTYWPVSIPELGG